MRHYYTNNEDLQSKRSSFVFTYCNQEICFTSDIGVFSKTMIDYGSRVLLETIKFDSQAKSVLDVGCGYGTFGVTLKKVYPQINVDMVDVNDRAIELCELNASNNDVDVNVFKSDIYESVKNVYDVIITNPPIRAGKEVVHKILSESYNYLNDNGELWVVIQKKQGAPSAKEKMSQVFGNCDVVKKDKGYYILVSKKNTVK